MIFTCGYNSEAEYFVANEDVEISKFSIRSKLGSLQQTSKLLF